MKNSLFALLFTFVLCGLVGTLSAHPLGNFSVNQFTHIEAGASEISLHQVLDFAEIPTFQAFASIDMDKDGSLSNSELSDYLTHLSPAYISGLTLENGQTPLELSVENKSIRTVAGEGELLTMRLEWDLISKFTASENARIKFLNNNYPERIGWREVIVTNSAGVHVYDSTGASNALSNELRTYPADRLASPLAERSAEFSMTTGNIPVNSSPLARRDGVPETAAKPDKLTELISVKQITPAVAFLGLLIAFGLGAFHAMSPGHGKTVVGAYLVGSKGTPKHALFLGLIVTLTHTIGVFALGLITLFASSYILPEKIMPFLGFLSGLIVFFIGVSLLKDRAFSLFVWKKPAHDNHEGHDEHDGTSPHSHDGVTHTHGGSTHSHAVPDEITWRNLLALGISGGLLPCPSALVLMLSAISLGRIGYGLVLTIAFSFGLAATLTVVGLVFLNLRTRFGRSAMSNNRVFQVLPVLSAFVIAVAGAVICYTSLG